MDTKGIDIARRVLVLFALVAAVLVAPSPADASARGISVVSSTHPDPRLYRYVVRTPALARPVRVNVLVPAAYASTTKRYPVLYLFHGTSGGADDWLQQGGVRATTAGRPLIVVMADAGYDSNGGSLFTNWVDQQTVLGAANWESFHIGQLIPWVDGHFRTRADRAHRAIAGLSQGGFGAFSYAARHPDRFVAAASFSGAPDIARHPVAKTAGAALVAGIATGLDGVPADSIFGNPVRDSINWQGHNPASLVTNLAPLDLELWTGDGTPGPLDPPTPNPAGTAIEAAARQSTLFFTQYARAAGVRFRLDDYGPGTHTWPYWARDLRQYLPRLMHAFGRSAPRAVSYASIERTWRQWGWRVATHRAAKWAFSSLTRASARGFTYRGAAATVMTPPLFVAGAKYRAGGHTIVAGADRRLRVKLAHAAAVTITRVHR